MHSCVPGTRDMEAQASITPLEAPGGKGMGDVASGAPAWTRRDRRWGEARKACWRGMAPEG